MKTLRAPGDAYRAAEPGEINHAVVDRFTIAHFAVGVLMGAGRMPWWGALAIAVGWELVERPLKRSAPQIFPHATQDTVQNAVGDAVAMMAGWVSWQVLPKLD